MKLTGWYETQQKPIRIGWYECKCCQKLYYWDKRWYKDLGKRIETTINLGWRGIAK